MIGRRSGRSRSWDMGASVAMVLVLLALSVMACGPEASRSRDGGTGGSSRPGAPTAPPTGTGAPELRTVPTANTPYSVEGTLPALPTRAAA
ncbi:MAG: hypothetical protein M3Q65_13420, partial [Chloroflexota bacterium]|nr:hypothetical protein [Chloroflexota bacterium]